MPTYDSLRVLAFSLAGSTQGGLPYRVYSLALPERWKGLFRRLASERDKRPGGEPVSLPVDSLNKAMRALVPDLISVNRGVGREEVSPWLLSASAIPSAHLDLLVRAWLRAEFSGLERAREQVLAEMRAEELRWETRELDLSAWRAGANGTAEPVDGLLYTLWADAVAARLTKPGLRFQFGSESRQMYRVPGEAGSRGAEVMSWPPLWHADRRKQEWPYSVVLQFTVQTLPFSPKPVLHCEVILRRWAIRPRGGDLFLPKGETSVYLRASVPWLGGELNSQCFQVAPIATQRNWNAKEGEERFSTVWGSKLTDILGQLSLATRFPSAREIRENAADFLTTEHGVNAAVVYSTRMSQEHGVGAGFMPKDRRAIADQVVANLAELVVPVEKLPRAEYRLKAAESRAELILPGREALAPEELAETQRSAREAVGAATGGRLLLEVLHQTDATREALTRQVRVGLGLVEPEVAEGELRWTTPELNLRLRTKSLGEAGAPLSTASGGNWRDQRRKAMEKRSSEIGALLPQEEGAAAALIELGNAGHFASERGSDPKAALRLGAALHGRVSQFLTPPPEGDGDEGNLTHRARQSVRDLLRQVGVQFRRSAFSGTAVPSSLSYVGVWLLKQSSDSSPTGYAQEMPVMVWTSSSSSEVKAIAPGFSAWLPYREALVALAKQPVFGTRRKNREDGQALQFIEQVLRRDIRGLGDTLLLTHAQNLRGSWTWLSNGSLVLDHLGFGARPEPISEWQGLRHVRVRTSESGETPECFAESDDALGFSKGVWRMGESGRVFGSTAQKPVNAKHLTGGLSKFEPWRTSKKSYEPQPDALAWNPSLVELTVAAVQPGDDPATWAAIAHELRSMASHYDEATVLPLPLHLAEQMEDYLLPLRSDGGA